MVYRYTKNTAVLHPINDGVAWLFLQLVVMSEIKRLLFTKKSSKITTLAKSIEEAIGEAKIKNEGDFAWFLGYIELKMASQGYRGTFCSVFSSCVSKPKNKNSVAAYQSLNKAAGYLFQSFFLSDDPASNALPVLGWLHSMEEYPLPDRRTPI